MSSFDIAFDRLIGNEGGYVNDPNDPGGETNWGISKRSYPMQDIKNMSRDEAKAIYLQDFWNRAQMDKFPFALAFQVFDAAVNHGIETAVRLLQRALGVADDGHIGPVTMQKASIANPVALTLLFIAERLEYWTKCSKWPSFGAGWTRRGAQDIRYAVQDL